MIIDGPNDVKLLKLDTGNKNTPKMPEQNQPVNTPATVKAADNSNAPVKQAVEKAANNTNVQIKQAVDKATGLLQTIVTDNLSDEVIRKMPQDEYLQLLSLLDKMISGSIDNQV